MVVDGNPEAWTEIYRNSVPVVKISIHHPMETNMSEASTSVDRSKHEAITSIIAPSVPAKQHITFKNTEKDLTAPRRPSVIEHFTRSFESVN
ncbi:hypothetical protein C0J52_06983 [Blattella germanica]|nr:hypothetical protein C0J52_06983 [Blattella germanica]